MTLDQKRVQELFNAVKMLPPSDRGAYLEKICGDNDTLRAEVESLLQFTPTSARTLEGATIAGASGKATDHKYKPGDRIFDYEIVRELGEGGFGVVYFAKQHEPVKRDVALKVLLAKRCTDAFIRGFETEQQTLANMRHPGIAHLYDAGVTDHNLPFFVMEYIPGQSITAYCDEYRLDIRDRLSLFVEVCVAVQYAHDRGVVHRDLTPNNILISVGKDEKPRPQIIDFGIARMTSEDISDMAGTVLYMSPEQANPNNMVVDTSSDIFTLGVVLYELMVGQTPLDSKKFRESTMYNQLNFVRNQNHLRPSKTLSELPADTATSIADLRQCTLWEYSKMLTDELDWLPFRALKNDPARRFDTALEFGEAVKHYLNKDTRQRLKYQEHAGVVAWSLFIMFFILFVAMAYELNKSNNLITELRAANYKLRSE